MVRYELPPGLPPEEERALVAALDAYLGKGLKSGQTDRWQWSDRGLGLAEGIRTGEREGGRWLGAAAPAPPSGGWGR